MYNVPISNAASLQAASSISSKIKSGRTRASIYGMYFGRMFSHVADTHLIHYHALPICIVYAHHRQPAAAIHVVNGHRQT